MKRKSQSNKKEMDIENLYSQVIRSLQMRGTLKFYNPTKIKRAKKLEMRTTKSIFIYLLDYLCQKSQDHNSILGFVRDKFFYFIN